MLPSRTYYDLQRPSLEVMSLMIESLCRDVVLHVRAFLFKMVRLGAVRAFISPDANYIGLYCTDTSMKLGMLAP